MYEKDLKLAIVAIGYNRQKSLARLLHSLDVAEYSEDVDLIISIDKSDSIEVENLAEKFVWRYGKKEVIKHSENLGLRNHILSLGRHFDFYDALIVLEDDIWVAPDFYNFSIQAVNYYYKDNEIAGISLYNHLWNMTANRPFVADYCGMDIYFMQYAQSWGQVWIKDSWKEFKSWYDENLDYDFSNPDIPKNVNNWPDSSWLKFHVAYCIEKNKYFVYPHIALTTNFTDVGTHNKSTTSTYQVPLNNGKNLEYKFTKLNSNDAVTYDAFFERQSLSRFNSYENILVNLYDMKVNYKDCDYMFAIDDYPYEVVKRFGLDLKPHELNVINDMPGNIIKLYDLSRKVNRKLNKRDINLVKWSYDTRSSDYRTMFQYIVSKIREKLFNNRENNDSKND